MYHGVPRFSSAAAGIDAQGFESQVKFLKKHFALVNPEEQEVKGNRFATNRVLITLDDGFRNSFEVVAPILRRYSVPAIFFISSRHCEEGKFLWFVYLRGLLNNFKGNGFKFYGEFMDMAPARRGATMKHLRDHLLTLKPHPNAMYQAITCELPLLSEFVEPKEIGSHYAGMTAEQVHELASEPLFSVGVHTVDHPMLTKCEPAEAERQIEENKAWLERVTGKSCKSIAYPGGDYDHDTLKICQRANLTRGYAVDPSLYTTTNLEVPRVGIYSPSLGKLCFKAVCGGMFTTRWGRVLHRCLPRATKRFEI
jgi:peptidoglycan/xylan/chitin deacetylase (PgdA/CDA1 family)